MKRIGLLICLATAVGSAQQAPSFEIAAIKPSTADQHQRLTIDPGGRLTADSFTLKALIAIAYHVTPFQMQGGKAGWIESERWSIQAKAEGITDIPRWSPPNIPEIMASRLRGLLEERFLLRIHREQQLQPSYLLTEAKAGSKLIRAEKGPGQSGIKAGPGVLIGVAATMEQIVGYLNRLLDRPLIDKTGLTGNFNFKLQFAPESTAAELSNDPSLFTALQEQLGLKLESAKLPAEILVIDQAQRPTAN